MKIIPGSRRRHYLAIVSVFLVAAALIAGMVGCNTHVDPPLSQNLEIQTWYDLDAVRYNMTGNYTLLNDLASSTAGYTELAGPTANEGKGWDPIGSWDLQLNIGDPIFSGTFDGQGYEIRDLFINRPGEGGVGLFGFVGGGVIKDIGVVNADVTSGEFIGSLVGCNNGTVSNSYSAGSVNGTFWGGGLVGFNFEEGTVSNSYSTSNAIGGYGTGGLAGGNWRGTVSNSYATGSVTGYEGAGGLLGANWEGTVSNSYSTGSVTGDINAWGLVGFAPGTVSNSFWDTETSGQSWSPWGGTGKNTTEMQDITTFSGAGWNITTVSGIGERNPSYIWNIVDDVTYPFLSWQS